MRDRRLLPLAVLALLLSAAPFPVVAAEESKDAAALLAQLPSQATLHWARDAVLANRPTKPTDEDVRQASECIATIKKVIPQLRPLIRPGTSVFDYPGLLVHGDLSWSEFLKQYQIVVGIYLSQEQGIGSFDFAIDFDAKGQILKVDKVIHKE
jgi:hypothetical protein